VVNLVDHPKLNHRVPTEKGLMAERCGEILRKFFAERRGKVEEKTDESFGRRGV